MSNKILFSAFSDEYENGIDQQIAALQSFGMTKMNLPANITDSLTNIVNDIFNIVWLSGIQILLFLSGLQSIPHSYYEAAYIEGANGWLAFWKITFPTLMPTMLVAVVYSIIDSFTYYANPVINLIQQTYQENMRFDYASTMSWMYFVFIIFVLVFVFLTVGRYSKTKD